MKYSLSITAIVLSVLLLCSTGLFAQAFMGNTPVKTQTGSFIATWTATPSAAPMNGSTGLSQGEAAAWGDIACIVRFNPDGYMDVRNGSDYMADDTTLVYEAGVMYTIQADINIAMKKYSVTVTPEGGSAMVLATDYDFRAGAPGDTLNNFITFVQEDDGSSIEATLPMYDWENWALPFEQTYMFGVEFDIVPDSAVVDVVIGLCETPARAYGDLASIARFNAEGTIDARNGGAYEAAEEIMYEAGKSYHFKLDVDVSTKTYDIFVTPEGGDEILLGDDFGFRADAGALNWYCLRYNKINSPAEVMLSNWMFIEGPEPPKPPMPPIVMADHPPAIDGELDVMWMHTPWNRNFIVSEKGDAWAENDPSHQDAALSWRAMWDDDYLYFYVSVNDDSFSNEGNYNWQDDGIEVWIDGDNSKNETYDGLNDIGIGCVWEEDNPLVFSAPASSGNSKAIDFSKVLYGGKQITGDGSGLRLELAIPWSEIGVMPSAGHLIGFDVDFNDSDTPGDNRNTKLKYFDPTDNTWQNPSLMGTVELVDRTVYDFTDVWYTENPPMIDGMPDDMSMYPTFTMNNFFNSADSVDNYLHDVAMWFQTVWDSSYLYYSIMLNDDVFDFDAQLNWQNDQFEVWFDGDNSKMDAYDGVNDFGFQFPYIPDAPIDSVFMFTGTDGHAVFDINSVMWAASTTEDGLFLEFALPMDSIGVMPKNGWMFAHEIDWNDSDTPGLNRDTKCKTFSPSDNTWNNPSYLTSAKLMGGPGGEPMAEVVAGMIDRTAAPPVIDGEWEDLWENARNWQMSNIVDGGTVDDWWDSYANFRVLVDDDNLYMLIQVHDDTINVDHANDYERDSIELMFDGDNSKNSLDEGEDPFAWPPVNYDENDDQLRFVYGSAPISSHSVVDISAVDYAYAETEMGWNLEFSMPLDGQPFMTDPGTLMGFEVTLNDNDGGDRESIRTWWTSNDAAWNDPSSFGTVQFTDREINDADFGRLLPIPFTPYPVQIDGEMDYAWMDVAPVFSNYRVNSIDSVHSEMDIELNWKATWDYDNLYLMVNVVDDSLVQDGEYNYQDDGIEMWWDGDASLLEAYTDENDLSFGWTYDPDMVLSPMTNWRGALDSTSMAMFTQAQKRTEYGLVLEMAMPWEVMGTDAGDGALVGIEIDYNDDDTGGERDTKAKSYDPTDNTWQNPSLMSLARLVGSKIASEVDEDGTQIVEAYELGNNYPNPFNPVTNIEFRLPEAGEVKLVVFDVLGREVMRLVDGPMQAGVHRVQFDAAQHASGVYFYKLQAGGEIFTKKMMLLK